jgi:hypothetical protein
MTQNSVSTRFSCWSVLNYYNCISLQNRAHQQPHQPFQICMPGSHSSQYELVPHTRDYCFPSSTPNILLTSWTIRPCAWTCRDSLVMAIFMCIKFKVHSPVYLFVAKKLFCQYFYFLKVFVHDL